MWLKAEKKRRRLMKKIKSEKIKSEAEQAKTVLLIANCFTSVGNLMSLLDQQTYDDVCGEADDLICQKEIWRWGERIKMLSLKKYGGDEGGIYV